MKRFFLVPAGAVLVVFGGCANGSSSGVRIAGERAAIQLECIEGPSNSAGWVCPAALTIPCQASADVVFAVQTPSGASCSAEVLSLAGTGPLTPGSHAVELRDERGVALCTTVATVLPGSGAPLTAATLSLWPPNHKFHEIGIEDCIASAGLCDDLSGAEFTWASSDEPVDDIGDGHHTPDILIAEDCQHVQLRSERQGPSDGRVYKLGVRIPGVAEELVCAVVVDHDQSGVAAADSGEAYRVLFDGSQGGPVCDGTRPPTDLIIPLDAPL